MCSGVWLEAIRTQWTIRLLHSRWVGWRGWERIHLQVGAQELTWRTQWQLLLLLLCNHWMLAVCQALSLAAFSLSSLWGSYSYFLILQLEIVRLGTLIAQGPRAPQCYKSVLQILFKLKTVVFRNPAIIRPREPSKKSISCSLTPHKTKSKIWS